MTPPCLLLYFFLLGRLHIIVVCGRFIRSGCVGWDNVVDDVVKKTKAAAEGGSLLKAAGGSCDLLFYVGQDQDKSLCFYVEDKLSRGGVVYLICYFCQ
jgi:hypothetical protein